MPLFNGPRRGRRFAVPGGGRSRAGLVLRLVLRIAAAAFVLGTAAAAQQIPPLSLSTAEDLALAAEPGQAALRARASAMREEAVQAAELPDPMLRTGVANLPLEAGGFTTEGMTQAQLGLRQQFPPGRTREYSARRYASMADELYDSAAARGRDVLAAVRHAWLETHFWNEAREVVTESRPLFADLVTVTRSLYAVGTRDQQDLLRAELELSRLDDRLIEIERQRATARAALSEWIGDAGARPLPGVLPAWDRLPPAAALHDALLEHPALQAADARIAARRAQIDVARERYKPGWALDIGYSYRDGLLPNGSSRSDFVSVMVTVDLPLFRGKRQDRAVAAALSERRAADAAREQQLRRMQRELDSEYARWHQLTRRVGLYDSTILGQAEDRARAALFAYQSGAGDFADVMRGRIDELNTRLEYIRLRVQRAQSYAVLANLGGLPR